MFDEVANASLVEPFASNTLINILIAYEKI